MISSGTLAATLPDKHLAQVQNALNESGTSFAVVGRVTEGKGLSVVRDGVATRYSELKPEEDELARLWRVYTCTP